MKKLKMFLLFLFVAVVTGQNFAQDPNAGDVLKPSKYPDGIYTKENSRTRRAIPYTTLREADVMWSKRVWRMIDLKESEENAAACRQIEYDMQQAEQDKRDAMLEERRRQDRETLKRIGFYREFK